MSQFIGSMGQPGDWEEPYRSTSAWSREAQAEGWHEPYESRGSYTDLWGAGGEIPPAYPAGDEGRPLGINL